MHVTFTDPWSGFKPYSSPHDGQAHEQRLVVTAQPCENSRANATFSATWFQADKHYSACQTVFSDADLVVALNEDLVSRGGAPRATCAHTSAMQYGLPAEISPYCNKTMVVESAGGVRIELVIQDVCMLCQSPYDIDVSRAAMKKLAKGNLKQRILPVCCSLHV